MPGRLISKIKEAHDTAIDYTVSNGKKLALSGIFHSNDKDGNAGQCDLVIKNPQNIDATYIYDLKKNVEKAQGILAAETIPTSQVVVFPNGTIFSQKAVSPDGGKTWYAPRGGHTHDRWLIGIESSSGSEFIFYLFETSYAENKIYYIPDSTTLERGYSAFHNELSSYLSSISENDIGIAVCSNDITLRIGDKDAFFRCGIPSSDDRTFSKESQGSPASYNRSEDSAFYIGETNLSTNFFRKICKASTYEGNSTIYCTYAHYYYAAFASGDRQTLFSGANAIILLSDFIVFVSSSGEVKQITPTAFWEAAETSLPALVDEESMTFEEGESQIYYGWKDGSDYKFSSGRNIYTTPSITDAVFAKEAISAETVIEDTIDITKPIHSASNKVDYVSVQKITKTFPNNVTTIQTLVIDSSGEKVVDCPIIENAQALYTIALKPRDRSTVPEEVTGLLLSSEDSIIVCGNVDANFTLMGVEQ